MYEIRRYHVKVTDPTREQLGDVYRYIKGKVASSGKTETCVTFKAMESDLRVDYDNLRYRVECLEGKGVIARRPYTTKSGKSVYLYRILK